MNQQQLLNIEVPAQINKTGIKSLGARIINDALDNNTVLKVAEGLAVLDKLVKAIREEDRFVDAVVEAVSRTHTTANGTVIEVTEVGVSYDYSHDDEWRRIQEQIDTLTEQRKDREAQLKNKVAGREYVDEDTGEVLVGAGKKSKTSYKITLAK